MNDFQFADLQYGYLLWGVVAFAVVIILLDRRTNRLLHRFLSPMMQSRLITRTNPSRRLLSIGLLVAGLGCLVLALMRPQWGITYREMPKVGAQIMVCLDVSRSMLAEDTAPNRLQRAKLELGDLLSFLDEDRVGLIGFAGRATVLCPMTNDFGFLRLILENAGPQSVGRGGTRLEEPIRKAIDGFGDSNDAAKVILLITDGEDLDSFPLEAAAAARERGIKIIAIGFGDENGSRIEITDPTTGIRSFVTDENGQEIVTRLDGESLREIALATDGVYIPAGTGVLDLNSIYLDNIRPLMRGTLESQRQAIPNDGFQWPLLLGFVLIVLAVTTGSSSMNGSANRPSSIGATVLIGFAFLAITPNENARGQTSRPERSPDITLPGPMASGQPNERSPEVTGTGTQEGETSGADLDPRMIYNTSVALMKQDLDQAEQLLQQSRRHAKVDGEVRFRTSYNLGWVDVIRADRSLESDPNQSLKYLESAANWFREAIRLNPKNDDARHNLEIVLRRILELADSLAGKDDRDFARVLDELIARQRTIVSEVASLTVRASFSENASDSESFIRDCRASAVKQRQVLSEIQGLSERAGQEVQSLSNKSESEITAEENIQLVQLGGLLRFTQLAAQRMGQARSQLRFRQPERAHRRAAISLVELKRARDQLREPAEVLRLLLADAESLIRQSAALESAEGIPITNASRRPVPAWLTHEFLLESVQVMAERTDELAGQFEKMFRDEAPNAGSEPESMPLPSGQAERFRQTPPLVRNAADEFSRAHEALIPSDLRTSTVHQANAIDALKKAIERLLDLKGLIEIAYRTQDHLTQNMGAIPEGVPTLSNQVAGIARSEQQLNLERASRIAQDLSDELQRLESEARNQPEAATNSQSTTSSTEESAVEKQRFEVATSILNAAKMQMELTDRMLSLSIEANDVSTDESPGIGDSPPTDDDSVSTENDTSTSETDSTVEGSDASQNSNTSNATNAWNAALQASESATDKLAELRRLFFSIAEWVRDTAQRQQDLNDEASLLEIETDTDTLVEKLGPLVDQQSELERVSSEIQQALAEQMGDAADAASASDDAEDEIAKRYAEAADLVGAASQLMKDAVDQGTDTPPQFTPMRENQDMALEKLVAALARLNPPDQQNAPPENQDQNQNQDQQNEEGGEQSESDPQSGDEQEPYNDKVNGKQLLQMVRDREAQRRQQQNQNRATGREPVLKDW